jgi:phytoene dehydrogenase-like protein
MKSQYDVVILGAGHNGLVAASYLGRAGLSVLILEKNNYVGEATTSQKVFPDYDAQLLGLKPLEFRWRSIFERDEFQRNILLTAPSDEADREVDSQ